MWTNRFKNMLYKKKATLRTRNSNSKLSEDLRTFPPKNASKWNGTDHSLPTFSTSDPEPQLWNLEAETTLRLMWKKGAVWQKFMPWIMSRVISFSLKNPFCLYFAFFSSGMCVFVTWADFRLSPEITVSLIKLAENARSFVRLVSSSKCSLKSRSHVQFQEKLMLL